MAEKFVVSINMVPDPMLFGDILEVVIDTNVYLPTMFTVLIQDTREAITGVLKYTDNAAKFKIGDMVNISVISENLASGLLPMPNTLLPLGEITSIEPIYEKNGTVKLRLRGFDKGHRLTYGKKTRVFGTGTTPVEVNEAMIVSKIAAEHGLVPMPDPTLTTIMSPYVMQYNQSDWDFLMSRAQLFGYQMYVLGPALFVVKAGIERPGVTTGILTWGEQLVKFEPRIVGLGQVMSADATGWDARLKMKVVGMGTVATHVPPVIIPATAMLVKDAGKLKAKDVIMDPRLQDISQATRAAQALVDRHASQYIRATGELSVYNPYLLAGHSVMIAGVGMRFSGKYYVTQARHTWRAGVAKVTFEVSGQNPYTFRQILSGDGPGNSSDGGRIVGPVIGVVTDNLDPMMLGRVKVKYPWMPSVNGMEIASNWARVASPGAGATRGISFTPEINDEVLVVFEQGDFGRPYIIGGLWNSLDRPPMAAGPSVLGSQTVKRIIRSRSGHMIVLDDTTGAEKILIQDKSGQNKIVIDSIQNTITISGMKDIVLEPKGNFTVNALGQVKITGQAGVQVETNATLGLKGITTTVEGTGSATLKTSAGQVAINGPAVNINNGALEVI
jgi:uncharacterized protein involved in type VI secretion and phage assembly